MKKMHALSGKVCIVDPTKPHHSLANSGGKKGKGIKAEKRVIAKNFIDFESEMPILETILGSPELVNNLLSNYFQHSPLVVRGNDVSNIKRLLFDFDIRSLLDSTSSESIQVWLKQKDDAFTAIESIRVMDGEDAVKLHRSGHSLYCRAPKDFEDLIIPRILSALGHGAQTVATDRFKRGEIEMFYTRKGHITEFHSDFQENFTIQLTGKKRWSFMDSSTQFPIRGCTPHFSAEHYPEVAEQQLKSGRLCDGSLMPNQFEGCIPVENIVELQPGDVMYHPAGLWHRVECTEDSLAMNISLISASYAEVFCGHLQQLLWEVPEFRRPLQTRPDQEQKAKDTLKSMLEFAALLKDNIVPSDILTVPVMQNVGKMIQACSSKDHWGDIDEDKDNENSNENSSRADCDSDSNSDDEEEVNEENEEEEEEEEDEAEETDEDDNEKCLSIGSIDIVEICQNMAFVDESKDDVMSVVQWLKSQRFRFNPFTQLLRESDLHLLGGYSITADHNNAWVVHTGFGNEELEPLNRFVLIDCDETKVSMNAFYAIYQHFRLLLQNNLATLKPAFCPSRAISLDDLITVAQQDWDDTSDVCHRRIAALFSDLETKKRSLESHENTSSCNKKSRLHHSNKNSHSSLNSCSPSDGKTSKSSSLDSVDDLTISCARVIIAACLCGIVSPSSSSSSSLS